MENSDELSPDQLTQLEAFRAHLFSVTPRVWVTPVIIAINALVFVLMLVDGVGIMDPTIDELLAWGANFRPLTATTEPWRLFTSMWVHIGIIHILFNMYVLADAGPLVERLLGNASYLALYVLSGLGGSLLSAYTHADIVSAGASGPCSGCMGGCWAS